MSIPKDWEPTPGSIRMISWNSASPAEVRYNGNLIGYVPAGASIIEGTASTGVLYQTAEGKTFLLTLTGEHLEVEERT